MNNVPVVKNIFNCRILDCTNPHNKFRAVLGSVFDADYDPAVCAEGITAIAAEQKLIKSLKGRVVWTLSGKVDVFDRRLGKLEDVVFLSNINQRDMFMRLYIEGSGLNVEVANYEIGFE